MDADEGNADRHRTQTATLDEFDEYSDQIDWVTPAQALSAESERSRRIDRLAPHLVIDARNTKPHLGPLSPGCRICGQGSWSCLFINGACNCRCFYCPSPQNDIGVPTTHRVPFADAGDYADYVSCFGYRGVSISGGEPLLTPDRTLRFLRRIKQDHDRRMHLWMYTNGTRLTAELVGNLRDAGLDEIRFDLSAVGYDLSKVKLATGCIPCVTVEIPAIPEDAHRVAALLPVMRDIGVNHLNLHQLRLTRHNLANLKQRKYTYLHGDAVTVLESELAAFGIMQSAVEHRVDLPINYCSFVYKHRFQRAAARRNSARFIVKGHESITENGYLRTLSVVGDPQRIAGLADRLAGCGADVQLWSLSHSRERLLFHQSLWPTIDFSEVELRIAYAEARLCPHITYRRAFTKVPINPQRTLVVERQPVCAELHFGASERLHFADRVLNPASFNVDESTTSSDPFTAFERIQPGLQAYH